MRRGSIDEFMATSIHLPSTRTELGRRVRDEGVAFGNANGDAWWRDCFDRAVGHLASTGHKFTTDEVFAQGVRLPDHPNRVGAAAAKSGVIAPAGYRLSTRPSRHAGVVREWTGTGGEAA
jgi:hypothetical protein